MRPFSSMASSASRESRERVVASFFFCVCMYARALFRLRVCDDMYRTFVSRINQSCNLFFDFCHAVSCVLTLIIKKCIFFILYPV